MKKGNLIQLILLVMLFSGCQKPHQIKPNTAAFKVEFDHYQENITITFDEPVIPFKTDETFLTISPELNCPWVWLSDKHLRCQLSTYGEDYYDYDNDVLDNILYSFQINIPVKTLKGDFIQPGSTTTFASRPEITHMKVIEWNEPNKPVIDLTFNTEIHTDFITDNYFSLVGGGKTIDINILPFEQYKKLLHPNYNEEEVDSSKYLLISNVQPLDYDTTYQLLINQKLTPKKGNVSSDTGLTELSIKTWPQTFTAEKLQCSSSHWYRENYIYEAPCFLNDYALLMTNRSLLLKNEKSCPDFKLLNRQYPGKQNGLMVSISELLKDQANSFSCLNNISDLFNTDLKLSKHVPENLSLGFRPNLSLTQDTNQYLPINQAMDLEVNSINVQSFQIYVNELNGRLVKKNFSQVIKNFTKDQAKVTAVKFPFKEEIQSISGHISIPDSELEIPFNVIKAPFHINIKTNLNHFSVLFNNEKDFSPLTGMEVILKTPKHKYVTTTNQVGLASFELNAMDFAAGNTLSELTIQVNIDGNIYTFNELSAFAQRNRNTDSYSPKGWALDEGSLMVWGITDKPLYRAGEVVKYQIYVRQKQDKRFVIPIDLPTMHAVVNGRNYQTQEYIYCESGDSESCNSFYETKIEDWNEFGGYSGEFTIPKNTFNGEFFMRFDLPQDESDGNVIPNDKEVNSEVWFEITDFKTSPYLLSIDSENPYANNQQPVKINAQASYYSGGPVAGEMAEITTEYVGTSFTETYPEYHEYTFNTCDDCWGNNVFYGPLNYDENGSVFYEFTPEEEEIKFGHIKINSGIKPEGSGWTYSEDLIIPYHSQPYFLGIKTENYVYPINEPINFDTILVDFKGELTTTDKYNFQIKPLSGKADNPPIPFEFSCTANQKCTQAINHPGRYQVLSFTEKEGQKYESRALTVYITDNFNPYSFEIEKATRIVANQDSYQVGDTAKIDIFYPDDAVKSLVFIERNQVLNTWYKETNNGSIQVSFVITEEYSPGFSVNTAILAINDQQKHLWPKPIKENTVHFTVSSQVNNESFSFHTDKESYLPGGKVALQINSEFKTKSEYTVIVIDESVLSLIDPSRYYDLTDSYLQMAVKEWESLDSYELYPYTVTQIDNIDLENSQSLIENQIWVDDETDLEEQGRITVTGSRIRREDLGAYPPGVKAGFLAKPKPYSVTEDDGRIINAGPISIDTKYMRTLFKESAYFQGGIEVLPGQSKTHTFILPDNMGTWRVLLVGTNQTGYLDVKQQFIKANKSLEIYAKLPEQLTAGDQFTGVFSVVSKSENPSAIEIAANAKSEQGMITETFQQFNPVQPHVQYNLELDVTAKNAGKLKVLALAKDETVSDGLLNNISVRNAETVVKEQQLGQLSENQLKLKLGYENPIPKSDAILTLQLSQNLYSHLHPSFDYMENYPHACWEQQLSKAVTAWVELKIDTSIKGHEEAAKRKHIENLLSQSAEFQASNGGMTFFNAHQDQVNAYLTFYTHQMFKYMSKQGFKIPSQVNKKIEQFAEEYLSNYHEYYDKAFNFDREFSYLLHPELYLMASEIYHQAYSNKSTTRELPWYEKKLRQSNQSTLTEISKDISGVSLNSLIGLLNNQLPIEIEKNKLLHTINEQYFDNGSMLSLLKQDDTEWQLMNSALKTQCLTIDAFLALPEELNLKNIIYQHVLAVLDSAQKNGVIGSTLENSLCLLAIQKFIDTYEHNSQSEVNWDRITVKVNNQLIKISQMPINIKISTDRTSELEILNPELQQIYYSAQVAYPSDIYKTPEEGMGIDIKRTYQRFTSNGWLDADLNQLSTGDWVKTQVFINNPTDRSFVAVSSPNPGAWSPVNITLSSTVPAGIVTQNKPVWNSPYFYQRQLNPATSLFYADYLPAGIHYITYYAQVNVAGEFSILPAKVEAMYNSNVNDRTKTEKVTVH